MPHRDQYEIYIKCPKCGKQGEATWEEDESPVYGRGEKPRTYINLRRLPSREEKFASNIVRFLRHPCCVIATF